MFRSTITTTDPTFGAELPIPDWLRAGVERAAEIVEKRVKLLSDTFTITADWSFVWMTGSRFAVKLTLTADRITDSDPRTKSWLYDEESFRDEAAIHRQLSPALSELGRMVSALVEARFAEVFAGLRKDIEAFAALPED